MSKKPKPNSKTRDDNFRSLLKEYKNSVFVVNSNLELEIRFGTKGLSKPITKILDKHCDIILVGDSIATAFYGMKNTWSLSLETIINHAKAVRAGIKKSTFVVDMPFNTYKNIFVAKKNVKKVFKLTKCDAIKIESNGRNFKIISHI